MRINWRVRFKNPQFLLQLALSIGGPVFAYMGLTVADLTSWGALGQVLADAIGSPYVIGLALIGFYNAVNDPTTDGITDSAQAMRYSYPKKG